MVLVSRIVKGSLPGAVARFEYQGRPFMHRPEHKKRANPPVSWLYLGMNVQVAVLCDAATDENGKLNLLGAFDTIIAPQLPAVHPQCSIALRIAFAPEDEGQHKLRLNFVDEDGRSVMPNFPPLPVQVTLPEETHFVTRNFIVNIQHMKFERPGLYSIDVYLDDKQGASIPLLVKHVPPQRPPEPGEEWKCADGNP